MITQIKTKIAEVEKGCGEQHYNFRCKSDDQLCLKCQAKLETLNWLKDIAEKDKEDLETLEKAIAKAKELRK